MSDPSAESMCSSDCLDCLREKAAAGSKDAERALKLLEELLHLLACRFLSGKAGDDCKQRTVHKIPDEVADLIDKGDTKDGDQFALEIAGFISRIIEDPDWPRR